MIQKRESLTFGADPGKGYCGVAAVLWNFGVVRGVQTARIKAQYVHTHELAVATDVSCACAGWILNVAGTMSHEPLNCIVAVEAPCPMGSDAPLRTGALTDLAFCAGAMAGAIRAAGFLVRVCYPRDWKGNMPKDVCWGRVEQLAALDLSSMGNLCEHEKDAIGLACAAMKGTL